MHAVAYSRNYRHTAADCATEIFYTAAQNIIFAGNLPPMEIYSI
jgi:hypothetical protein